MSKKLISINWRGSVLKVTNNTPQTKKKRSKRTHKTEDSIGTARREMLRSKNGFTQSIQSIINVPKFHLTLLLPHGAVGNEAHQGILMQGCLKLFIKKVNALYPKCYFVRTYGHSPAAGLHAHMVGRFGAKCSCVKLRPVLADIWSTITGSNESNLFEITKYSEATLGYLTSPKKDSELAVIKKIMPGTKTWGIFNEKNIKRYPGEALDLTPQEYVVFKAMLEKLIAKANLPDSTLEQLEKGSFCLNYLPVKLLKKLFKNFTVWRANHE